MSIPKGKIFLIPNYLSDNQNSDFISAMVFPVLKNLEYYIVENVRTTRRFISSLNLDIKIQDLKFETMDKRFDSGGLDVIFQPLNQGNDIGVQSEAGLAGIADPGKLIVSYAHQKGIQVIPLPGSSSIILALISSGLNGQQFTFHGYLPIDKSKRVSFIKKMESEMNKTGYTQVFMETPYRNQDLFDLMLKSLNSTTVLFVGRDITGIQQKVLSLPVDSWKKQTIELNKIPTVFAIGKPA
jgi:16S rRNA (cytidine1402-2'-O)-methyltransferase